MAYTETAMNSYTTLLHTVPQAISIVFARSCAYIHQTRLSGAREFSVTVSVRHAHSTAGVKIVSRESIGASRPEAQPLGRLSATCTVYRLPLYISWGYLHAYTLPPPQRKQRPSVHADTGTGREGKTDTIFPREVGTALSSCVHGDEVSKTNQTCCMLPST